MTDKTDALVAQLTKLCSWKHLMSYNDAYFGEPEGELKATVYAIERHLPEALAEQPAGAVGSAYEGVCPDCNNLDCDCDEALTTPPAASVDVDGQVAKLQAFKDYVHQRLDEAGVPTDPPSPHREAGCRVGGRLDWLIDSAGGAVGDAPKGGVVDFEIHAGGEYFASVGGPRDQAVQEALHYVARLHPEDGEPEVFEVTRTPVSLAALNPEPQP